MSPRLLALLIASTAALTAVAQRDSVIRLENGGSLAIATAPEAFEIGRKAPLLTGVGLDGARRTAPRKDVVYFYSFIGCKPCAAALEQLEAGGWRLRGGRQLVYVNAQDRPAAIGAYIETHYGADAFDAIRIDARSFARAPVYSFPQIVVTDGRGRITDHRGDGDAAWVAGLLEEEE